MLSDYKAESTGVEPVRACAHWFSRPTHYRPAHSPNLYILSSRCVYMRILTFISGFVRISYDKIDI